MLFVVGGFMLGASAINPALYRLLIDTLYLSILGRSSAAAPICRIF